MKPILLLCLALTACGHEATAPKPVEVVATATTCKKLYAVSVDTVINNGKHYAVIDSLWAWYSGAACQKP